MEIKITDRDGNVVKIFETERREAESVLNLLERVRENADADLAFYGACGIGKCGACGMSVNGKAALACTTPADGDAMELAPLPGGWLVRDLLTIRNDERSAKGERNA